MARPSRDYDFGLRLSFHVGSLSPMFFFLPSVFGVRFSPLRLLFVEFCDVLSFAAVWISLAFVRRTLSIVSSTPGISWAFREHQFLTDSSPLDWDGKPFEDGMAADGIFSFSPCFWSVCVLFPSLWRLPLRKR